MALLIREDTEAVEGCSSRSLGAGRRLSGLRLPVGENGGMSRGGGDQRFVYSSRLVKEGSIVWLGATDANVVGKQEDWKRPLKVCGNPNWRWRRATVHNGQYSKPLGLVSYCKERQSPEE